VSIQSSKISRLPLPGIAGFLADCNPSRDYVLKTAAERNSQPLPQIRHNFGLKLPNDRSEPFLSVRYPFFTSTAYADESLQQLRPEHVTNILKRPAEDDFDV
ncbi:unnamed protein product, partial [Haemonchus placei]|uniref:Protein aurora borealis n=1 Tax=Haemonchus placei TaxID=6290 RepID=A0A0N4X4B6_HAEPC